jgi:hypothetical protein
VQYLSNEEFLATRDRNCWRRGVVQHGWMGFRFTLAGLVWLTGCFGEQTIHGQAILTGQADSSAIVVCGACAIDGGGRTCFCTGIAGDPPVAADGSYTLEQNQSGPNAFTASAPSTLEGSIEFTVDGDGDVDAPTVMLTPLGTVTGTVAGPSELEGIVVAVDGSSQVATTGATGAFTIDNVVSGPETLTAFQPGSSSTVAHASVVVPYAASASAALSLAAD